MSYASASPLYGTWVLPIETDTLSDTTVEDITHTLIGRTSKDRPFTKIGDRIMIGMKPARSLQICSDTTSKDYAAAAKATLTGRNERTENSQPFPPHIFDISASSYFHAVREKTDQSIILMYKVLTEAANLAQENPKSSAC